MLFTVPTCCSQQSHYKYSRQTSVLSRKSSLSSMEYTMCTQCMTSVAPSAVRGGWPGCQSRVSAGRAASHGVSRCGSCASHMDLRGAAFQCRRDVVPPDGTPIMSKKGLLGGGVEMFDYLAVTYLGRGRRARGIWRGGYKGIPWCGCGIGPTPWRPPVSLQAPCAGVSAGCRNT